MKPSKSSKRKKKQLKNKIDFTSASELIGINKIYLNDPKYNLRQNQVSTLTRRLSNK